MKSHISKQSSSGIRYWLAGGLLCLLFIGLLSRLVYLQVFKKEFLQQQGQARTVRVVELPAYRGVIKDRHGEPLAVSTPIKSVWVNPKVFNPDNLKAKELYSLLGVNATTVLQKLDAYADKVFMYLSRHVDPIVSQKIKSLAIPGVYLQSEYRRYYPAGEVSSHVLGFTNIDDQGLAGLELAYEFWLKGTPGQKRIIKDRLGREVERIANVSTMQSGHDLELSLDQRLQYLAFRALKQAVEKHEAVSGSAVVLRVQTGEVLAMVNQPTFNPNRRTRSTSHHYRNRAVTDCFEPASSIKAFSLASVLESGQVSPMTRVNTSPGVLKVKGGVIRDLGNYGLIDIATILKRSSNIGISKLVLKQGPDALWDTYTRLGFGVDTGSGFPGESHGVLSLPNVDQPFTLATMAFGYGLAVTPLQMARAYAILGANGIKRPVTFTKVDDPFVAGQRVMRADVARDVVGLLATVVAGEHSNARVPGYHVAGKTGTGRLLGKYGYETDRHRAVFGGLAPAIDPQFAIVVTIEEPTKGQFYSNQVAAPVFSSIASGALRLFNVLPNLLDAQGVHMAQSENYHS